jgi:hypothetical protein
MIHTRILNISLRPHLIPNTSYYRFRHRITHNFLTNTQNTSQDQHQASRGCQIGKTDRRNDIMVQIENIVTPVRTDFFWD